MQICKTLYYDGMTRRTSEHKSGKKKHDQFFHINLLMILMYEKNIIIL